MRHNIAAEDPHSNLVGHSLPLRQCPSGILPAQAEKMLQRGVPSFPPCSPTQPLSSNTLRGCFKRLLCWTKISVTPRQSKCSICNQATKPNPFFS